MNANPALSSNLLKQKPPTDRARFFYTGAAALLLVLMFIGFQQFYLHGRAFPSRPLTPPIRTLLITHGIAMTAWVLLLLVQPLLIANQKFQRHMFLGRIGAVLAVGIFLLGLSVAIHSAKVNPPDQKLWGLNSKQFLAVPVVAIVMFAAYVAIGVWKRRQADVHRPMMFLSTLIAVAAATDRIPFLANLYRQTIWGTIFGPFFTPLVVGAVLLVVRWALTRSFDRYYTMGYAGLIVAGVFTMKIAPTNVWDQVATFLMR